MRSIFKFIYRVRATIRRHFIDPALDFVGGGVLSTLIGRTLLFTSMAFSFLSAQMLGPALFLVILMGFDIVTHIHVLNALRRLMLVDLTAYADQRQHHPII